MLCEFHRMTMKSVRVDSNKMVESVTSTLTADFSVFISDQNRVLGGNDVMVIFVPYLVNKSKIKT